MRIGLALGSGSARGWSQIGVIRALGELGIRPDVVTGTSIGALVGAAWVSGYLDRLESWIRDLDRVDILRLMDPHLKGGGFIRGEKLMSALGEHVRDMNIEDMEIPFAAVATDLASGREIWLREGSMLEAVRASIALPGIFAPARVGDRWLVDGGLVNPVPVSLCRALDADVVIAVNLNGDIVGKHLEVQGPERDPEIPESPEGIGAAITRLRMGLQLRLDSLISSVARREESAEPGLFDVLAGSINIVQDRITRSRMAGDPPEVIISPRLSHIRLMEFDRGAEAIRAGEEAVARIREDLEGLSGG